MAATPSYGLVFFLPSLVQTFGYNMLLSQLLTVPLYLLATISSLAFAYHSDKKRERPLHMVVAMSISIVGFLLLAFVPKNVAYFATLVAVPGSFSPIVLTLAWLTNTMEGPTRGATATALVISLGNLFAFVGWLLLFYAFFLFNL